MIVIKKKKRSRVRPIVIVYAEGRDIQTIINKYKYNIDMYMHI